MMKNIRLYTFAVLFAHLPTPEKIVVYMKSRDKLSSRMYTMEVFVRQRQ